MQIAYTMSDRRGVVDRLLWDVAPALRDRGMAVAGTIQRNSGRPDAGPCDMDLKVLPDGPLIRISQDLGRGARGCRLDMAALEQAAGLVAGALAGVDCLIVNKFGKHEAAGRGFCPIIARAVELGVPVLVGLNSLNEAAFVEFTGGVATQLDPDRQILTDWVLRAQREAA